MIDEEETYLFAEAHPERTKPYLARALAAYFGERFIEDMPEGHPTRD